MNKEGQWYIIESASKALISFIPGIGGAIGSILSDALADRKEERIKRAIESLAADLSAHKDSINQEFINKEDFLDVTEKTFRKIMDERSEVKRLAYKNILLTGILSEKTDYFTVEEYLLLLEQLFEEHLLFLRFIAAPKIYERDVLGLKLPVSEGVITEYLLGIFPDWDKDLLLDIIVDLENRRLITHISTLLDNQLYISGLIYGRETLRKRGRKFMSYILR